MDAPKLTIRLRDPRLHALLKVVAKQRGMSINRLVEQALAHELDLLAARTEQELLGTLELLRSYRGDRDALTHAFAAGELEQPDPLRSEPLAGVEDNEARDPLGALAGFHSAT